MLEDLSALRLIRVLALGFGAKITEGKSMSDRLKNLVHHLICTYAPHELGVTKLAKILWFADVERFRIKGATLSGADDYRKNDQGPFNRKIYLALDALKKEQKVFERPAQTPVGPRREFVWMQTADLSDFTADEIALLDRIAAKIVPMTARQVSDSTHDELWEAAQFGQRIPVAAGAVTTLEVSDEMVKWAEAVFDERGAAA